MPDTSALASTALKCPACDGEGMTTFFELTGQPVFCNVLHDTQDDALSAPRGDLRLAFCPACEMIHNDAFDPELVDYDGEYENALHFSQRFVDYQDQLQQALVDRYNLRGKKLIEIGCGDGTFLQSLCALGNCTGTGFDPSYRGPGEAGGVEFVADYYSATYADRQGDFVCSRHVLEHVPDPLGFLKSIRAALVSQPDTAVYIEVPNALYTLRDLGIWDMIYEHCNYFTPASLAKVITKAGFGVRRARETYGGQFIGLEAIVEAPSTPMTDDPIDQLVTNFAAHYRDKTDYWNKRLDMILEQGRHVAVWGAGSKGVSFLNTMKRGRDIQFVIDINPRKQGRHVAGSGQIITGPDALPTGEPITVLIMNLLYRDEIAASLRSLGVSAQVEGV